MRAPSSGSLDINDGTGEVDVEVVGVDLAPAVLEEAGLVFVEPVVVRVAGTLFRVLVIHSNIKQNYCSTGQLKQQ